MDDQQAASDEIDVAIREYERLLDMKARFMGTQANTQTIHASVSAGNTVLIAVLIGVAFIATACCGVSVGMLFGVQRDLARAEADAREIRDYYQVTHRRLPQMQQALDELLKEKADGTDHSGR